jgi:hypothetical protein
MGMVSGTMNVESGCVVVPAYDTTACGVIVVLVPVFTC